MYSLLKEAVVKGDLDGGFFGVTLEFLRICSLGVTSCVQLDNVSLV